MKKQAENYLSKKVTNCVITLPCHFNECQRNVIRDAATIAGLNLLRYVKTLKIFLFQI